MKTSQLLFVAAAMAVGIGTYAAFTQPANAQLPNGMTGTYSPIGVASSAQGTTAWFIDTTKNQVVKCSETPGRAECVSLRMP